jgi:hypothetical protein
MESADKLSYEEIRKTIYETVQYARRIIKGQNKSSQIKSQYGN